MKPVEFLNEIVALFQDGEREDALELIDAYLIEHTDDSHARLLKAEMCLELDARPDYVGQALLELEPRIGHTRHFKQLQRRVEDMISRKMSEGRDLLRRESGQAALACFEMACELAPYDPAVPLAAALAWIDQPAESESELAAGLLSQRSQSDFEIGTPPGDAGTDDVLPVPERFLHLALRRSTSGEGTHAQAEGMLVDCWLERGQFVRVAEWLEKTTLPSDAVVNRREKLIQRLTAHIDGTVRALLRAGEIERAEAVIAAWEQQQPPGPRAHLWRAEALRLRELAIRRPGSLRIRPAAGGDDRQPARNPISHHL